MQFMLIQPNIIRQMTKFNSENTNQRSTYNGCVGETDP